MINKTLNSKKSKVLFVLPGMYIGGVEKSFLNLIANYDQDKYELHLGLFRVEGGFLDLLPKSIKIHHIDIYDNYKGIFADAPQKTCISLIKQRHIYKCAKFVLGALSDKYFHNRIMLYNLMLGDTPSLDEYFDIAIAYSSPDERSDYFICKKVNARRKFVWVHFDISKSGYNKNFIKSLYINYEKIFLVSKEAKNVFDGIFPYLVEKTEFKPNKVDRKIVVSMADQGETFIDDFDGIRILTVGRISEEKGQDIAIKSAALLRKLEIKFKWYFIGDGYFKEKCMSLVEQFGLSDNIVFLGIKKNPYPYMRDCDVYVQPSRHEGFCITLAEARCFDKPIVVTDFCGAREQLENYRNYNRICGKDENNIASEICNFLMK